MATTWIKPIHKSKTMSEHASVLACLKYILNGEKTGNDKYVFAHGVSGDAETDTILFRSVKEDYNKNKADHANPIYAYSIRQAFLPGEIDAETALKLGELLAMKITGGEYHFVVATHVDKSHIHNHLVINAFNNNRLEKFQNPLRSYKDLRRMSDEICKEHGLSIVEEPGLGKNVYSLIEEYQRNNKGKKPTNKKEIELFIEAIIRREKPKDIEMLFTALRSYGCEVNDKTIHGEPLKHISVRLPNHKRATRLNKLSEEYTEEGLRRYFQSTAENGQNKTIITPQGNAQGENKNVNINPSENNISSPYKFKKIIDIANSTKAQENAGYMFWAKGYNLKQASQTLLFLQNKGLLNQDDLAEKINNLQNEIENAAQKIKNLDNQMKEISLLQKHIGTYRKTRDIFGQYQKLNYDPQFYEQNKKAIEACKNAKEFFNKLGNEKLPSIDKLKSDYAKLMAERNRIYAIKNTLFKEHKELKSAQENIGLYLKGSRADAPPVPQEKPQNILRKNTNEEL